jgi:hypothetical protein
MVSQRASANNARRPQGGSLQRQGVPVPDHLQMRRHVVRQRTPLDGRMGGTQDTTTTYENRPTTTNRRASRSTRDYNPASVGEKATGGVGALEAEFLVAIGLLILLMFANSGAPYTTRIMSLMKRGSLTCLLFFILALIASGGPNAAKIAKGFGGLIIVAILLTSPVNTVFGDIDNIIKNDWVGSTETEGGTNPASADTGTASSTSSGLSTVLGDLGKLGTIVDGQALAQKVLGAFGIHL